MMYVDFAAGGNEYKLRLNTRDIVSLEKRLGCNPMSIFGNGTVLPSVTQMVDILHASLQQYQHNVTLDKAYGVFDSWIADGHTMTDFLGVIVEIYRVSGIIPKEDNEEKN